MSIKEHPGDGTVKPVRIVIEHNESAWDSAHTGAEVVSLAIDDVDQGNDPYNQTGRFVSTALKDKAFD